MDWKVLKSEDSYQAAIKRTLEIFHFESSPEVEELELLFVLIKDYEDKYVSIPAIDPLETIKLKMEEKGYQK